MGYQISLEIILLMCVIYLVMIVHVLASCCNPKAIAEGFSNIVRNNAELNNLRNKMKDDKMGKGTRKDTFPSENRHLVENIII